MMSETIGGARHFDAIVRSKVKLFFNRFCAVVGSRSYLFAIAAMLVGSHSVWAATTINEQYTPATINPGDTSQFKITILNASMVALTQAKVTVLLAPQVTIAATPNIVNGCGFTVAQGSSSGSTLELTGGNIPAGNGSVDG